MFGLRSKPLALALAATAIVLPLVVLLWNPYIGGLLILCGLFITTRCFAMLRANQFDRLVADEAALVAQHNRGCTILVSLVDKQGLALPADLARARLDAAQAQTGPRDTVVGVHRSVE